MTNTTRVRAALAADLAPVEAAELEPTLDAVLVDCASCAVREVACADCVVTVLLGSGPHKSDQSPEEAPPPPVLAAAERAAIDALAGAGLVPRLRHLPVSLAPLGGHTIGWDRLPHPDAGG